MNLTLYELLKDLIETLTVLYINLRAIGILDWLITSFIYNILIWLKIYTTFKLKSLLPGRIKDTPDPPSRRHLLRCLRSLLSFDRLTILSKVGGLAPYCLYVSVGAPWRLVSNTLLVPRVPQKRSSSLPNSNFDGGFWTPFHVANLHP
jgi:hypothetical protein